MKNENIIYCAVIIGFPLYCELNKELITNRKELMLLIYYIRGVVKVFQL